MGRSALSPAADSPPHGGVVRPLHVQTATPTTPSARGPESPSPRARRKQSLAQRHKRVASAQPGVGLAKPVDSPQSRPKSAEAPSTKGEWIPAAVFIFLSHVLVMVYLPAYLLAHLSGTSGLPSSLFHVSTRLKFITLFAAWLNLLGITAGYHRLWSHAAFRANTGLSIFLAIIGLCSFQGSARCFTDMALVDPYDSTRGLWYSHIGWLFEAPPFTDKARLIDMRDVDEDPVLCFQKRYLLHGYVVFGLFLPGLIGLATDGSFLLGALWIGFVGRFLSWHCIWTINSLSHWRGVREFSVASSAVYCAIVNLVQNGEGHHNYHHAFPRDYRHGHRWYEWDPTKWCIAAWSLAGWATELQMVDTNQVMQAQAQVLEHLAHEIRAKAIWGAKEEELPTMTREEFELAARKAKGDKILLRLHNSILDVTFFSDHPGGVGCLRAYHGRDITAAFSGGINLHTQAAQNLADMYRIARCIDTVTAATTTTIATNTAHEQR